MLQDAPRIIIQADSENEDDSAELSTISLGYALHQTWIFAVLFGTSSVFGITMGSNGLSTSPVFAISIVVYAVCLLVLGAFDQKLLPLMVDRRTTVIAAMLMTAGTLLILLCEPGTPGLVAWCVLAGALTGVGSAVLIVFWGIAFARENNLSLMLNTAIATFVSVLLFALVLNVVPSPVSGVLAALLPWPEIAFLRNHTPVPYSERRELPIFNPLPVRHVLFMAAFGLPMLLFGLPLGFMREQCTLFSLPSANAVGSTPLLLAAGLAALVVILAAFASAREDRVDFIARILVPAIAVCMLFIPFDPDANNPVAATVVMMGFMCFESLAWILMSWYAQQYRVSPVLIFGAGRGAFALGTMAGTLLLPRAIEASGLQDGFATAIATCVLLVSLLVGFSLLPHDKDVRRMVVAPPERPRGHVQEEGAAALPDGAAAPDGDDAAPGPTAHTAGTPENGPEGTAGQTAAEQDERRSDAPAAPAAPAPQEDAAADPQPAQRTLFREKCERVANRYLLSARESEVLFYLARGFNAAALQEKLYISEGTAKTHIRHIYGKTNVHNQHELMKMVNDEWID